MTVVLSLVIKNIRGCPRCQSQNIKTITELVTGDPAGARAPRWRDAPLLRLSPSDQPIAEASDAKTGDARNRRLTCHCSGRGPLRYRSASALLSRVAGHATEWRVR
jgi:hypothetical protein